jgi:hypothetical protein
MIGRHAVALPQSGQGKRPPVLNSISMSSRFFSASKLWHQPPSTGAPGRVLTGTDRYRAWLPSSPVRRHRAAVLAAVQGQALTGARSSRVLDRHSTRRSTELAAGTKGWVRRGQTNGLGEGQKAAFPRLAKPLTVARRRISGVRLCSTLRRSPLDVRIGRAVFAGIHCWLAAGWGKHVGFRIVSGIGGDTRAYFEDNCFRCRAVL